VANRKTQRADDENIDSRPHVPGLYGRILPVVCLREVRENAIARSPGAYLVASDDPEQMAEWGDEARAAEAAQLAAERLAAGTPIEAKSYDLPGLPAPLDTLGHDPAPRYVTITADDRVSAEKWQQAIRALYERARWSPNCDHGHFQAAMNWPGDTV